MPSPYTRPQAAILAARLLEPRRFLQAVAGPRQVGKTTLVQDVVEASGLPARFASADEPTLRGPSWIEQQWEATRLAAVDTGDGGAVLVLDEIQKIPGWSESVKRLWDEDTRVRRAVKVVLLGSAPLLVARALSESLAGRFELLYLPHWSYAEMRDAFGWSVEHYVFYGGYPGAAPLIGEPRRWARYIIDSLIETTLARDVLLLSRVDKPAVLRRLSSWHAATQGKCSRTQNARSVVGCRQCHHTRPLSRPTGGRGDGCWPPEVCRRRGAPARLEPEAAGAQHGVAHGADGSGV
jgi:predicted AAA+ superfamily ATPase